MDAQRRRRSAPTPPIMRQAGAAYGQVFLPQTAMQIASLEQV